MKDENIHSAIILCGGMSRRMGEDKGSMKINEKPMIIHIIEALNQIDEIIIVLNDNNRIFKYKHLIQKYSNYINNNEYFDFKITFVEDEIKNKGPLSGIMTGLKTISSNYALILPCDSPYITPEFVKYIFKVLNTLNSSETLDGIVPYHNDEDNNSKKIILNKTEPLHSIYKKETYPIIENLLKHNEKQVKSFINSINCHFIPINNKINKTNFKNINYKNDLY